MLFGDYSYGHVSREVPTHIYLMHWDLSALEDGKWNGRDEFKPCFSALKHVSSLGNGTNATGKEYHEQTTDLYVKRVYDISNIHVFNRWRTDKLVPLAIGGHPVISKHLLRWIFSSSRFPSVTVQIEFHYTGNFVEEVNVAECLAWLTESTNTTREEMYEHQIIQEYLLELQIVTEAENVINICDKLTWGDHDLSKLEELVWNDIGPIPCHTQYMENVVQTSGWVGKK